MKFKDNDLVRITGAQSPDRGAYGTIIAVFDQPQEAYEVELLDETGTPRAQHTLLPEELELVVES